MALCHKHNDDCQDMRTAVRMCIIIVFGILILLVLNLFIGAVNIPAREVLSILLGTETAEQSRQFIVMQLRLPQALTAILCGGGLAATGLMLQTVFRNPLADPSVFGISSGASLGVALVMLAGGSALFVNTAPLGGYIGVVGAAFIGAMAVTTLIFMVSTRVRSNVMLVIIGIMVGYLASSIITILSFLATEQGIRMYSLWGMGDFGVAATEQLWLFAIIVIVGIVGSLLIVKQLNVYQLGEDYATNLGIDVTSVRNLSLVLAGLMTAATTAFCGPIAFIGLAVPHLARLLLRNDDHRVLMPTSILLGCVVALACNLVRNLPANGSIIPINAITPLIGAPVIIYIVLGNNRYYSRMQ